MARDNSPKERQRKQLERKKGRRASYDRILIVSEGSKTEPNYFRETRAAYRLHTANVEVRPSELARKFHHCPEIVGGMATATPTMAQRTGMGASRGAILPRRDSSPLPPLLFNMPGTALWPNYGASACAA